jgi:hypothetical protein
VNFSSWQKLVQPVTPSVAGWSWSWLEEALEVYRELDNKAFVARTKGYLDYPALLRNNYELAENQFRQSLRQFSELHEIMGIVEGL